MVIPIRIIGHPIKKKKHWVVESGDKKGVNLNMMPNLKQKAKNKQLEIVANLPEYKTEIQPHTPANTAIWEVQLRAYHILKSEHEK